MNIEHAAYKTVAVLRNSHPSNVFAYLQIMHCSEREMLAQHVPVSKN